MKLHKSLLGVLVLVSSVVACGPDTAGPGMEPELAEVQGAALGDVDDDTIPDAEDNCPRVSNVEQFDSNQNGRGDACDFNLIPFRPTQEGIRVSVGPSRYERMVPLAVMLNNSGMARDFTVQSNRPWLQVAPGGTVQAGARHTALARLIPAGLPLGTHRASVSISVGGVISVVDIIINIFNSTPDTCEWVVSLYAAEVTEGQGVFEGKLEVQITGSANGDSAVYPRPTGHDKLAVGESVLLEKEITRVTLPDDGSIVPINVGLSVNEEDGGFLGADDSGSGSVMLEMQCDTAPVYVSKTIGLGGSGKVSVTVEARQEL